EFPFFMLACLCDTLREKTKGSLRGSEVHFGKCSEFYTVQFSAGAISFGHIERFGFRCFRFRFRAITIKFPNIFLSGQLSRQESKVFASGSPFRFLSAISAFHFCCPPNVLSRVFTSEPRGLCRSPRPLF